jgi:uncharacterized membrane protein YgcG
MAELFLHVLMLIVLIAAYCMWLSRLKEVPGEKLYYCHGKLDFDSVLKWLNAIEKDKHKNCEGIRNLIEDYRANADETGRDYSYYDEYITPQLKYQLLQPGKTWIKSWRLLGVDGKIILFLIVIWVLQIFFVFEKMLFPTKDAGVTIAFFILLSPVIVFALAVILRIFVSVIRYQFEHLRSKGRAVGPFAKRVLAFEGLMAFLGNTTMVGADVIHVSNLPGDSSGGGSFGGGGSGGGGFSGFGGGSFGGGGSSGSW